ncbi:exodeoxyribonuclease VII, large subunit [Phocaeicola salanitronis DSM 18170]|uniref:Exodeoxyribonuclease 7 large subunit n=1 Tax=Phocaeicola salanitronis (strain DSM 18170 / JCM 13657 / CCUG 60908 / BL78) TaxID=667015 RepID=F0R592_PHOSB|nr:exodeoxyribonuclease VII large subunit [Phocaeicola salanitronis]ADY37846.1 exodeoxyribonuclease VII, large subunit [Phocaeicola salanitronis DSM 18170]
MEHTPLSLYELNALVRQSVRLSMPDAYWVQAELSDVRTNYSGHCYLEFVQKDPKSNALLAKARGIVWSNVFRELKPYFERETGQAFVAGLKVLVRVTVDFHELYGYSLTVSDIDPTYTLGDMAKRRREILQRLEEEGVLTLNKELELPELTQRIAVISSPTAAGYGDFCDQLERNAFGFVFYTKLFPAVMQGEQVEASIIRALNRINAGHGRWDVVVIIRGGGATSDLSGFDTYELATNCAQFPIPIITGIGHERDDTVIDKVAHTRVKTPTAAAEFLINHLRKTADRLETYASFFYQEVPEWLGQQKERLERWVARIPARVQMRIQNEGFRQERLVKRVHLAWQARMMRETYRLQLDGRLNVALQSRLQREGGRLQLLEQQVRAASPELLLQKGYSITLKNGKAVTDASALHPGDEVVTRVAKGEFKSKVL